jgi:hypothetical protein
MTRPAEPVPSATRRLEAVGEDPSLAHLRHLRVLHGSERRGLLSGGACDLRDSRPFAALPRTSPSGALRVFDVPRELMGSCQSSVLIGPSRGSAGRCWRLSRRTTARPFSTRSTRWERPFSSRGNSRRRTLPPDDLDRRRGPPVGRLFVSSLPPSRGLQGGGPGQPLRSLTDPPILWCRRGGARPRPPLVDERTSGDGDARRYATIIFDVFPARLSRSWVCRRDGRNSDLNGEVYPAEPGGASPSPTALRHGERDGSDLRGSSIQPARRLLAAFLRIWTKERPRSSSRVRPLFATASASVIAPQFHARRK